MIRRITGGEASTITGLDLGEFMAEPLHLAIEDSGSVALFAWRGPGIYEVHVNFKARGRAALDLGHAMLAHVRKEHGGRLFWSMVPPDSRHVVMFTRLMGWKSRGVLETRNGACELFVLEN